MSEKATIQDLEAVFGVSEVKTTTARVMTLPSTLTRELVTKVVQEFPLEAILRDLGTVTARELADYIETLALRPADYAGLPDLGSLVSERIMRALGKDSEVFLEALTTHLRLRG
jgi:hypothetical protein